MKTPRADRTLQRGRVALWLALLVAVGAVAFWVYRDRSAPETPLKRATTGRSLPGAPAALMAPASASAGGTMPGSRAGAAAPVSAASAAPAPAEEGAPREALPSLGYGLTLARAPQKDHLHGVAFTCEGEPVPQERPLQGGCDAARGDTSCRTVLPVLCMRSAGLMPPEGLAEGWSGAELGATQPVMGAVLSSSAAADARCEAELGPGWRMADGRGVVLVGARGMGLQDRPGRYWARSPSRANCWDGAGR